MSTRCYPIYAKGNPQLRVFLPNFWVKLVKPKEPRPPNELTFIVQSRMTRFDVRNYLEKIYKIPVVQVRTTIVMGRTRRSQPGYIVKDDDYKLARITLDKNEAFEFPNVFPESVKEEEKKDYDRKEEAERQHKISQWRSAKNHRPGVPAWFTF